MGISDIISEKIRDLLAMLDASEAPAVLITSATMFTAMTRRRLTHLPCRSSARCKR